MRQCGWLQNFLSCNVMSGAVVWWCDVMSPLRGATYGMQNAMEIRHLGGGFKYFLFSPVFGEGFQFD